MSDNFFDPSWTKNIKLPIKRVGDTWEFYYGGDIPVKEGTLGELVFSSDAITDEKFRQRVTRETTFQVLEEGTPLLVALSVRTKSTPYFSYGPKFFPQGIPAGTTHWERVWIGLPKLKKKQVQPPQQELIPESGGLWLTLKGLEKCELTSSTILMPEGFHTPVATSLNHAFTLLSRHHETHRLSNTGNVYTRVYYQDRDECWYPLDDLRRGVQAKEERKLLNELWRQVETMLGWRPIPPAKRGR